MSANCRGFARLLMAAFVVLVLGCGDDPHVPVVEVGPPAALSILSGQDQEGTVGSQLEDALVVRVTDANGTPVPGQIVNFIVIKGGGSVFAGVNLTNAEGIAQEIWTLGTSAADSQRVQARAVDNQTGAPILFATFSATALAASPDSMTADSVADSAAVASTITVSVRVFDTFGNPVSDAVVEWAPAAGSGSVPAGSTLTDSSGTASTGWTLGTLAGAQSIEASADGETVVLATTAVAGPAVTLELSPVSRQLALYDTVQFDAALLDAFGNRAIGSVTMSSANPSIAAAFGGSGSAFAGVGVGSTSIVAAFGTALDTATIQVVPLEFSTIVAESGNTCALETSAGWYCWGSNQNAQIDTTNHDYGIATPRPLRVGFDFVKLYVGNGFMCGLAADQLARCWGSALENNVGDRPRSPVLVAGSVQFESLSLLSHGGPCGLTSAGHAYCWTTPGGYDFRLGTGTRMTSATPVPVAGGRSYVDLDVAETHACALTAAGSVFCWGLNDVGQLGTPAPSTCDGTYLGSVPCALAPVQVSVPELVIDIDVGSDHTCAVGASHAMYCWGSNGRGQIGDSVSTGAARTAPTLVAGGHAFAVVRAGLFATCGLTTSGQAYCWGQNFEGVLGDGTNTLRRYPVAVVGGHTFTSLALGGNHACARATDGDIWCWGRNYEGQLGSPFIGGQSPAPVRVIGQNQ